MRDSVRPSVDDTVHVYFQLEREEDQRTERQSRVRATCVMVMVFLGVVVTTSSLLLGWFFLL